VLDGEAELRRVGDAGARGAPAAAVALLLLAHAAAARA
jgi:hypothetical protein